jgi:hypothetical protein
VAGLAGQLHRGWAAASLARDVPGLLGYRHFLAALAALLDVTDESGPLPAGGLGLSPPNPWPVRSWSARWWPGATSSRG